MSENTLQEQQLEEYKALRAEILALYARRSQRLTLAWTGISALLVGGAVSSIPELGWLALTLAASAWADDMHNLDSMLKAGTYIQVYIESHLPGLKWETTRARSDALRYSEAPRTRYTSMFQHSLVSNYTIFILVCLLATILIHIIHPPQSNRRWVSSIALSVVSAIVISRAIVESRKVPQRAEKWTTHFQTLYNTQAK